MRVFFASANYRPAVSPRPRPYPAKLPPIAYPGHYEVRRVCHNSCMFWQRDYLFVSRVLTNEYVGLEEIDDGV